MVKLLLRATLGLLPIMVLAIVMMLKMPQQYPDIEVFAAAPEMCHGTCIMGIRPYETTTSEAEALLEAHEWVSDVSLHAPGTGYSQILWRWSGLQPDWIDATHDGRITFYYDSTSTGTLPLDEVTIQRIIIQTNMRMPLMRQWYGMPDSGTAIIQPDGTQLSYTAVYHVPSSSIILSTNLPCPTNLMHYWNSKTQISLSIGWGASDFVPMGAMTEIC